MSQSMAEKYSQFFRELAKSTRHRELFTRHGELAIAARGPRILNTPPSIADSYSEIIKYFANTNRLSVIRASPSAAKDYSRIFTELAKYNNRGLLVPLSLAMNIFERINDLDSCTRRYISFFQTKLNRHIAESMSRGRGIASDPTDPNSDTYVDDEVEGCYHHTEAHIEHFTAAYERLRGEVLALLRQELTTTSLTGDSQEKTRQKDSISFEHLYDGNIFVWMMLDYCRLEIQVMEKWEPLARTVKTSLEKKFWMQHGCGKSLLRPSF